MNHKYAVRAGQTYPIIKAQLDTIYKHLQTCYAFAKHMNEFQKSRSIEQCTVSDIDRFLDYLLHNYEILTTGWTKSGGDEGIYRMLELTKLLDLVSTHFLAYIASLQ